MKRLHIVVEGPTEQIFVDELLYSALLDKGVSAIPHSMGGNIRWSRMRRDVMLFLKSDPGAFVTTFFDYYGLVHKMTDPFPGKAGLGKFDTARKKKDAIEGALRGDVEQGLGRRFDATRFIPYVQMHEFEGLLFSQPEVAATGMFEPDIAPPLRAIRDSFGTPEDINDDRKTAPSKRIEQILPKYDKKIQGNLAALAIGLEAIRLACPLFGEWVAILERLGEAPPELTL